MKDLVRRREREKIAIGFDLLSVMLKGCWTTPVHLLNGCKKTLCIQIAWEKHLSLSPVNYQREKHSETT